MQLDNFAERGVPGIPAYFFDMTFPRQKDHVPSLNDYHLLVVEYVSDPVLQENPEVRHRHCSVVLMCILTGEDIYSEQSKTCHAIPEGICLDCGRTACSAQSAES